QEAYILNGSLRENLTFGNENIPDSEIQRALELAGLWHDIQAMNGGWNTEIGEKGVNLSGGQRQRLSLARAVLHSPQLVVLDDPLSAVDPATEDYLVHHLLFGEWKNVTKVAITHRLSHLEKFDQIAFLDGGRLLGLGSFRELRAQCPAFNAYLEEYAISQAVGTPEPQRELAAAISNGDASRITEDEDREFGAVRGGVYWDYVLSLGGENRRTRPFILALLFMAAASGTVFPLAQKIWLAFVANTLHGVKTSISGTFLESIAKVPITAIYIYGGLGLFVLAGALLADLFWLRRGLLAGRNIHDKMLKAILGGRMRFFDSTPVGRILQRFSRDMEAIDIQLQWSFEHSMKCFAQVLVTLTLIVSTLPWIIFFIGPVLLIYYRVQKLYRSSAREAKRLDSLSRSPRYAHFKETLQGLVVIRAFGKKEWFLNEFYKRLSHSQRMFYGHFMINRWFSSRIPLVGGMVSLFTAFGIVLSVRAGTVSPGVAGLLTVYSLSFWGVLNWGIRIWSEVEARMTSMERVKYYSRIAQEQAVIKVGHVPVEWPASGEVRFEEAHLRYAEHLPQVLKGLSFTVDPGSKAGIIGRTGSGKSTLFQALYRFTELESGRILIDGIDIATIPLARLRRALAIIPQDPTLFMGTVRSNLDRYNEFSDGELWNVLDRTSLGSLVRSLPKGLLTELNENGTNLSQGQRQLMCLARALLLNAKVIILDEATASVDVKTDVQVQRVLRESCAGVTMLIIAHRLGTVRDCDQILEISEGKLRRRIVPAQKEEMGALNL
ncbi:MAG: ATP-binding cassette domain-containing protein, partial [Bdellovibrionales bacterium]